MKTEFGSYNIIGYFYDLLDYPFESLLYRHMRQRWIATIQNQSVLEIGVGTGKNLPYYHKSNKIIALDRERNMIRHAYRRNSRESINPNIVLTLQEHIPWEIPHRKYSQVVATFVFCTMQNPTVILKELSKWVEEGSRLLIFEFIKPNNPKLQSFINRINPITKLMYGVDFNRRPTQEYLKVDWEIIKRIDIINNFIIVIEAVKL